MSLVAASSGCFDVQHKHITNFYESTSSPYDVTTLPNLNVSSDKTSISSHNLAAEHMTEAADFFNDQNLQVNTNVSPVQSAESAITDDSENLTHSSQSILAVPSSTRQASYGELMSERPSFNGSTVPSGTQTSECSCSACQGNSEIPCTSLNGSYHALSAKARLSRNTSTLGTRNFDNTEARTIPLQTSDHQRNISIACPVSDASYFSNEVYNSDDSTQQKLGTTFLPELIGRICTRACDSESRHNDESGRRIEQTMVDRCEEKIGDFSEQSKLTFDQCASTAKHCESTDYQKVNATPTQSAALVNGQYCADEISDVPSKKDISLPQILSEDDDGNYKDGELDCNSTPKAGEHESAFVTVWLEKEKKNSKLMLATSLSLLQPPPHFNLVRDEIFSDFRNKRLYLFLDYDGTLTPIVNNPWEAHLQPQTRNLLFDLASNSRNLVTVGIVTGRALTSVKNFVQIVASENLNFIYAASHGFHIEAAGKMLHHRVGSRFIPTLQAAAYEVGKALAHIPGTALEDNEFAVTVHFRNACQDAEPEIEKIVHDIISRYPELKVTRGKKVLELRINVVWNKGRAVFWLLNAMRVDPFDQDTRVIYVGDDLTDEDAFKAVRTLTNSLTVLVSDVPSSRPTAATCHVKNPNEVTELLRRLLFLVQCSG